MAIETRSAFTYGHTITDDNSFINFTEDGLVELAATIEIGSYTLDQFKDAVAAAMNEVGDNEYLVTLDRTTRKLTITSDSNVELLVTNGTQVSISAFSLMGFSTNKPMALVHESDDASGSIYLPQAPLYKYKSFDNNESSVDSKVNESSSGEIELVTYGTRNFMEFNIKYATNIINQGFIEDNATGVHDLNSFMQYIRLKRPIEFLEDRDNFLNFVPTFLESTSQNKNGTSYVLNELYADGLANYFETGKLIFRKLN